MYIFVYTHIYYIVHYIHMICIIYIYIYAHVYLLWNQHLGNQARKPLMNDVNSHSSTGALRKYRLPDHGPKMGATNLEARLLVSELRSLFWVRNLALVLWVVRHKQDLLNLGSKETYAGTCASATASWQPTCPWDCIHIYIYIHCESVTLYMHAMTCHWGKNNQSVNLLHATYWCILHNFTYTQN